MQLRAIDFYKKYVINHKGLPDSVFNGRQSFCYKRGIIVNNTVTIFDSTLRDGAQAEGVSFSVEDKIKIVRALDELGIGYIEAGNPGSNPKDLEFFERIKDIKLNNTTIAAFGSTRRRGISPSEDGNIQALLSADTSAVAIFGKSWDFHVTDIINTTLQENLEMIYDTIAYLKDKGKYVVFDAEHFFDGYKENHEYALKTLDAAAQAGADCLCLCDTNGGTFPQEIYDITKTVAEKYECSPDNLAYIGDDINDLPCIEYCGVTACPLDGHELIKQSVSDICNNSGGSGAVREFIDHIEERYEASSNTIR